MWLLWLGVARASRAVVADVSDSEDGDLPEHGDGIPDGAYGNHDAEEDGQEGGEQGDGLYEYSDSEVGDDQQAEEQAAVDLNARPTVVPTPQVLKGIMKKR
jgi:hypothetical protein